MSASPQVSASRMLVLDDDDRWCEILTEIFKAHGIALDVAHTAEECLSLARSKKYELIIIDVILGKDATGGILVAKLLDKDPATRGIPKLFLTIVGVDVIEKEASQHALGVFTKPLDLSRLVQKSLEILNFN